MVEQGKFIVLYGINNLGKSIQIEKLENALKQEGKDTLRLKYPIYDLEPTGPLINAVLRKGLMMDDETLQNHYAQNRRDFEPTLVSYLHQGLWILAEDYIGTGVAWGMASGVSLEKLEKMNEGILEEDLAILFHGERFLGGKEANHRHESNDEKCQRAQDAHLFLSERYGWEKVYSTRAEEIVHRDIMEIIRRKFLDKQNNYLQK
ncbi:MAG: hypothetical protein Q7R43_01460 [Candidatus Daviesbacteria bacterium]|nr:hypothetical protein [Candidatus Daviesbacteria bacterium]